MTPILKMFVPGLAETKGSWIPIGGGRVKADNPRERAWAAAVGWRAKAELLGKQPTTARVMVKLTFYLPEPPNKTKKHRRDIDKLVRSVLDALTGIAFVDDEAVDGLIVDKFVVSGVLDPQFRIGMAVEVHAISAGLI